MSKLLAERIRQRLNDLGLSAREVSIRTTGKPEFLRPVLRGAQPRTDNLEKLAEVLGVSVQWLLGGEGNIAAPDAPPAQPKLRVPLISWVSAGVMAFPDVAEETLGWVEEAGLDPNGDWIALRVVGDSMDRISPPESIIFVDRKDQVLVPNACYVISNGDGEATYKRFRPNPMRFEPVSTNSDHEPIYPTREPLIVGRVKKSIINM
jgi:phage repressor protein C with HTH and peptisase S24 domain